MTKATEVSYTAINPAQREVENAFARQVNSMIGELFGVEPIFFDPDKLVETMSTNEDDAALAAEGPWQNSTFARITVEYFDGVDAFKAAVSGSASVG